MRVVALVFLGVITGSVGAADYGSDRWVEYSHVYATVANTDDVRIMVPILVHADEALEPLRVPSRFNPRRISRHASSRRCSCLLQSGWLGRSDHRRGVPARVYCLFGDELR